MPRKARSYSEIPGASLGTLCSRSHDHGEGKSYRNKHGTCMQCESERQAAQRAEPDYKARRKAARDAVKEREKPKDAEYRRRNAESLKAYNVAYMKAHPEKYRPARNRSMAKRKALKLCAIPSWANLQKIGEIYSEAKRLSEELQQKMAVDHIVPLLSERVCGLHCEANLQILTDSENASKGNRWWPEEVAYPSAFS